MRIAARPALVLFVDDKPENVAVARGLSLRVKCVADHAALCAHGLDC